MLTKTWFLIKRVIFSWQIWLLYATLCTANAQKIIFADDFSNFNPKHWRAEIENLPHSTVATSQNKLIINTKGGVTVWFKEALRQPVRISYKRKVLAENQPNDRLSDMNQFWLATESTKKKLKTRFGKFEEYDSLRLYYVGVGGNANTTTRFRHYEGNGSRTLLAEKNDNTHLLTANKTYKIEIRVERTKTSFWLNGQCIFVHKATDFPKKWYFGFRATASRQEISDFRIEQLSP